MHMAPTHKHFIFSVSFGLFLTVFITACASVSTLVGGRHKYDHAQNFEAMQRYNFKPLTASMKSDKHFLFIQKAGATLAIENGMASKKLRKERNLEPDFWVNYYFTGEQGLNVGQLNTLFTYNIGLAWDDEYGTGQGIANTHYRFSKRTLIIDIISKNNNRLIWRGSAPTGISPDDSPSSQRKALNKAISVILAPFPPQNNFKSLKTPVFEE